MTSIQMELVEDSYFLELMKMKLREAITIWKERKESKRK